MSLIKRLTKASKSICAAIFAPYLCIDSYGTHELCYTRSEAIQWLSVASPCALVAHRGLFGLKWSMIAGRTFSRSF